MKLDKTIRFLAVISTILTGIGEMMRQLNVYQQANKDSEEEKSKTND